MTSTSSNLASLIGYMTYSLTYNRQYSYSELYVHNGLPLAES